MDVEFHLPFSSAVPIETIPSKPSRLLMLFLTCRANEDGHAIALPAYLAIAVMTRKQSGKVYECVELTPTREAKYRTWQWLGSASLGSRTDICVAQSISSSEGAL